MQIETFECSETIAEPIEAGEEAIALIEALGLEGQKNLLSVTSDERERRMPFREMTDEESFVYGVMCPEKYKLHEYRRTPIPLRVLQIAGLAKELDCFEGLYVWDAASEADKDPVLVGVKQTGSYSFEKSNFILARWGEVLDEWPILMKRAVERQRESVFEAFDQIAGKASAMANAVSGMTKAELIAKGADWLPRLHD